MMKFNLKKVIPLLALTVMLSNSYTTNVFAVKPDVVIKEVTQLDKNLWHYRGDSLNTHNLDQILLKIKPEEDCRPDTMAIEKVAQILKDLYQGYCIGYANKVEEEVIVGALKQFNSYFPHTVIRTLKPIATQVKVTDELSILQNKIDKQVQGILSMFNEGGASESVDTVSFTDFLKEEGNLRSSLSKSLGFFTKLFRRPSFELELLKKISELKNDVLKHSAETSDDATFLSRESWNQFDAFLTSYLAMKTARDEKSKLAYAKKILSFPLRTLFGQTVKTNSYGGWALDKCIRLTMICLFVGTLCGSYNWWCANPETGIGFVGGFLMPFKIVKNVSVFGYSILKFLHGKITAPYVDLTWDQEYARQAGGWLWSFVGE